MNNSSNTSRSIHLSASAGSGKTRALKDRYLTLLDALAGLNLNIDQAVAITFTDKAAAEIKERVLRDLPEAMLKKIIRGRQDLRISTIHSFCMNLLKRYPLEAGLPPDFGVLDARDQAHKVQKAIDDTLEESAGNRAVMDPLRTFTADDLVDCIAALLSIRSRIKRIEIDAGGPGELAGRLRSGMGADSADKELTRLLESPEWRSQFRYMELLLKSQPDYYDECKAREHALLAETTDPDTALRAVESLSSLYFNKDGAVCKKAYIPKNGYQGKDRSGYENGFFEIQSMLQEFLNLHARIRAGREAESLLALFERAQEKYQFLKLREALLDFDDLEIYAYGLLQGLESPAILYWLDRKILHFLVDEFQDTSDIQWSILNRLTEEIFAGYGADKKMRPTLFVVGDEKQSIYRFREANYRLMESVRKRIEENLPEASREILTLDRNFRSAPEIVHTVNQVFGALWGPSYKPSEAERKEHQGSVRLIEIAPASAENPSMPDEAEVLAREIQSFIARRIIVYERSADAAGGWKERRAGYGDCAVLIQTRTRLKRYETALQARNIPYRVVGGIGFYEEDEIEALLNVLFFLWHPDDTLSLAAALKSPLFGCSDRDIYDLMKNNGIVDGLKEQRPGDWRLLQDWMNLAGLVPLAALVHRIIRDTAAYVRFGKRSAQAIFNIDKFLDTARDFDQRGYTTLQDFVEWVKNIRRTEQREAAADMNLPHFEGCVSIMTVHKAKGLEYPVVFLAGMNQKTKSLSSGPLVMVQDDQGAVRMAVRGSGNPVYDELWTREREELVREHQRLLYVAMTRARDHLVMIGTRDGERPVNQNSWLSYLHLAAPKPLFEAEIRPEPGFILRAFPETAAARETASAGAERAVQKKHEFDLEILVTNLSPVARSQAPEWRKATDFLSHDEKLYPPVENVAVSPLTRGSMLHRCLEDFTKTGEYDIARISRDYPDLAALSQDLLLHFMEESDTILQTVLSTAGNQWIFERSPDSYTELPFLAKKGHDLITGVIDRVVIKDGTGHVIDYKSILVENEEILAAWMDHYRPQVRIYSEAVKDMFRLARVESYLLFLDSNRLVPYPRT
jgi:ATP-dependent helicase/nuclease subunit A